MLFQINKELAENIISTFNKIYVDELNLTPLKEAVDNIFSDSESEDYYSGVFSAGFSALMTESGTQKKQDALTLFLVLTVIRAAELWLQKNELDGIL